MVLDADKRLSVPQSKEPQDTGARSIPYGGLLLVDLKKIKHLFRSAPSTSADLTVAHETGDTSQTHASTHSCHNSLASLQCLPFLVRYHVG